MENKKLKASSIRLAKVKYYDAKRGGVEVSDIDAYAFLYRYGEEYVNIFDLGESLPVFERVPYSNTTLDGEDFGTKLMLVGGDDTKSGACYILEKTTAKDLMGEDQVSVDSLQDYLLRSNDFFVDRLSILDDETTMINKSLYYHTYLSDKRRMYTLKKYFGSHENGVSYKK